MAAAGGPGAAAGPAGAVPIDPARAAAALAAAAAGDDPVQNRLSDLVDEKNALKLQRHEVTKAIKAEKQRKRRLKATAANKLTTAELLEVMATKTAAQAKAKAKAKAKAAAAAVGPG